MPATRITWRDHNNESVGILMEHGKFQALLTGDSEVQQLNEFLERGVPRVTVLQAADGCYEVITSRGTSR